MEKWEQISLQLRGNDEELKPFMVKLNAAQRKWLADEAKIRGIYMSTVLKELINKARGL